MIISLVAIAVAAEPPASERAAIFRAAGFHQSAGRWESDCGDPGTASYEPGRIEQFADLNGDGRPEALVTEGSTFCYGHAGTAFTLLTRSAAGQWQKLHRSPGVATFLPSRANGWPELEVGGPGFCFPVMRWNGKSFVFHRHAYAGKRCKP